MSRIVDAILGKPGAISEVLEPEGEYPVAPPFDQWMARLTMLAKKWYGITPGDFEGPRSFEDIWRDGETPEEYLEWLGEKYDLDRSDRSPWGGL